jgi:hypothetical protein
LQPFCASSGPAAIQQFVREGLRVSRRALLINDLVRHPLHLALVYAGYPIMRNRVAWLDGLTSVRRVYTPRKFEVCWRIIFLQGDGVAGLRFPAITFSAWA